MTTPNLSLPELVANQTQPHITINTALRLLDSLLQASVISQTATPPGSPANGDRHLVATGGTGAFAGHDDELASYFESAWHFSVPQEGWLVYLRSAVQFYVYGQGSPPTWEPLVVGGDVATDPIFNAKGDLIVGLSADSSARLPVGGTNGHVLTVDSAETLGVKWAAGGGGGGGDVATDAIWDADGDLVYGTGANTAARLPCPTTGTRHLMGDEFGTIAWQQIGLPVDIFVPGEPTASQVVAFIIVPSNMEWYITDFTSYSVVPATDYDKQIEIYRNATLVGILHYDDAGFMEFAEDVGTGEPYSGGNIKLVAPATPDATMADIGIRFYNYLK